MGFQKRVPPSGWLGALFGETDNQPRGSSESSGGSSKRQLWPDGDPRNLDTEHPTDAVRLATEEGQQ